MMTEDLPDGCADKSWTDETRTNKLGDALSSVYVVLLNLQVNCAGDRNGLHVARMLRGGCVNV